jgi:hypothetical protein
VRFPLCKFSELVPMIGHTLERHAVDTFSLAGFAAMNASPRYMAFPEKGVGWLPTVPFFQDKDKVRHRAIAFRDIQEWIDWLVILLDTIHVSLFRAKVVTISFAAIDEASRLYRYGKGAKSVYPGRIPVRGTELASSLAVVIEKRVQGMGNMSVRCAAKHAIRRTCPHQLLQAYSLHIALSKFHSFPNGLTGPASKKCPCFFRFLFAEVVAGRVHTYSAIDAGHNIRQFFSLRGPTNIAAFRCFVSLFQRHRKARLLFKLTDLFLMVDLDRLPL